MENKRISTRTLTGVALFTAIVVVLQFLGAFIRFGPFSISLVLIPIVVGAALYGPWAGAWLGFVFGVVVLLSGDAAAFLVISPIGTILVVLLKGALAHGPARSTDIQALMQQEGVSQRALMLAKTILGIGSFRQGGVWYWTYKEKKK